MIQIQHKMNCCGCNACGDACTQGAISFKTDNEGFWYPEVNKNLCVDCGLCEKVCQELYPYEEHYPLGAYAGINPDDDIRLSSSSGGMFTLLAYHVIEKGGVVFGAKFTDDWMVILSYTETRDGIDLFRGSKYLQAKVGTSYADAKDFLQQGRQVLFTGTPCQISGLKHYLMRDYDNLITLDIICHGVPSPKVWKKYITEVTNNAVPTILTCSFRNKDNGWKNYNFHIDWGTNGQNNSITSYHQTDPFMRGFLANMTMRPSCHTCKAKSGRGHSDITLGDFWGIQTIAPEMDDDKGTNIVLVNTLKGMNVLKSTIAKIEPVDFASSIINNPSWSMSSPANNRRQKFYKSLDSSNSVVRLIERNLSHRSLLSYFRIVFRRLAQIMSYVRRNIIK